MAKTKVPVWGWILIAVVAVAIFAPATFQGFLSNVTGGAGTQVIVTTPTGGGTCGISPTVQLTLANDVTGVNVTDANGLLYRQPIGSSALGYSATQLLSTSASFSVSDKDQYQFTVVPTTATSYYPFKSSVKTAGCAPAQLVSETIKATGTVVSTIYNDDDVTANTGTLATAQAISAGQTKKFRIRLVGNTNNAYFGDSAVLACADYNGSAYTSLDLSSLSGQNVTPVGTPYGVVTQDTTHNLYVKCWKVDGTIKSYGEDTLRLVVQANSVNDPSTVDSNINLRFADQYLNRNSNTNMYEETFFDQVSGAVIGATDYTDIISVS